jgi:hypothetical protein
MTENQGEEASATAKRTRTAELVSGLCVALVSALLLFGIGPVLSDAELAWRIGAVVLLAGAVFLAFVWLAEGVRPWRRRWWRPAVVVALLVTGFGVAVIGEKGPTPPPRPCVSQPIPSASIGGTVAIDNLREGQRIDSPALVVGSYDGLDAGTDLWIVVYAGEADRFYPQSHRKRSPATLHGGRFTSSMNFAGSKGESYEIMAVLADEAASRSLSSTLRFWDEGGSYPGLSRNELPSGLDEKDCVPVALAIAPTTTTSSTSTTTSSSLPTTTDTSIAPPDGPIHDGPIRAELELAAGPGEPKPRANASSGSTLWLHAGESTSVTTDVGRPGSYLLVVRYSNDNFGDLETVSIAVDGNTIGAFQAQDTGDFGSGWNVFLESPGLGPVNLSAGPHVITISVSGGDGNGVEIDLVRS